MVTQINHFVSESSSDRGLSRSNTQTIHRHTTPNAREGVYLVTSDPILRKDVQSLLGPLSFDVEVYSNVSAYLALHGEYPAACAIVDLDCAAPSALQKVLDVSEKPPFIFVGSDIDTRFTVRAMKAGAYDFFAKPLVVSNMLVSVQAAVAHDRRLRLNRNQHRELQRRFAHLTPREQETMPLVASGLLNKQTASLLGISEITVQIHRGQVMRKMQAKSIADLVRMAMKLRLPCWSSAKRAEATLSRSV